MVMGKEKIGNGGKDLSFRSESSPANVRFERVDVNNIGQMQQILEIVKDPPNMAHLAGISDKTGISDIIAHYKKDPKERDGRVMLDGDRVIGVFEVCPFDPTRLGIPPEEHPSWQIKNAILNRFAVRNVMHNEGIGTKIVAYAEEVAFEEHDYSALTAAIILGSEQKEKYDVLIKEGKLNKVSQDYEKTDARGKVFIKKRGWALTGVFRDQGGAGEGENNHVLIVAKTKADWEEERKQLQRKNGFKAA